MRVWDLSGGCEQAILAGHTDGVRSVAVSRDGTRAVSGGRRRDGAGVGPGRPGAGGGPLTGHSGAVCAVAVGRGRRPWRSPAATTGRCGCGTWPPAGERGQPDRPRRPGVGGGGRRADGARGGHRRRRRDGAGVGPGHRPRAGAPFTGHTGAVHAVAVSAGRGPCGPRRRRRDGAGVGPGTGTAAGNRLTGHIGWVRAVAVTRGRDPRRSAAARTGRCGCGTWRTGTRAGHPHRPAARVSRWRSRRTAAGRSAAAATGPCGCGTWRAGRPGLRRHYGWVCSVAVTPDGARAVTGGGDGTVRVWDLATGVGGPAYGARRARSCRWRSARRPRAVSGGSDRTVRVWDLATGRRAHRPGRSFPSRVVGGGHRGRSHGGQRRRRWHGTGMGPVHRPASGRSSPATAVRCSRWRSRRTVPARSAAARTGRFGCGTWRTAGSGRSVGHSRPGCGRWRSPRPGPARVRRRGRDSAGVGPERRPGTGGPDRPYRPGVHGGGHAGRGVRGKRGRGRLGTAVEPGRRGRNWPAGSANIPSSG